MRFFAMVLFLTLGACAPDAPFRAVALHEIGHVAGIKEHSARHDSVMNRNARMSHLSPYDRRVAGAHEFPDVCMSTKGLGPLHAEKFKLAAAEWNNAAGQEWLTLSGGCRNTASFGLDTKGHTAYTHYGPPIRVIFNWDIPWH